MQVTQVKDYYCFIFPMLIIFQQENVKHFQSQSDVSVGVKQRNLLLFLKICAQMRFKYQLRIHLNIPES